MKLEQGLVQIYTGNGKGKTTAAIGQGIRSYGNGLKVFMLQFLKFSPSSMTVLSSPVSPPFKNCSIKTFKPLP